MEIDILFSQDEINALEKDIEDIIELLMEAEIFELGETSKAREILAKLKYKKQYGISYCNHR